jgi:hypothetical protein
MRLTYRALLAIACLAALPAGAVDYLLDWEDRAVIFGAGSEKSYYMSVLYDAGGFPDGDGAGDGYRMWYASSSGRVKVTTSTDGETWLPEPGTDCGVANANHPAVLFEPAGFARTGPDGPATMYYRMYFWDQTALYHNNGSSACQPLCMMGYAESADGVAFHNQGWAVQAGTGHLIPAAGEITSPWRGSYGPFQVLFDPSIAAGSGRNAASPMANRYVMYYDLTTGGDEAIALAFSDDGLSWEGYAGNPIVTGTQDWETCGVPPSPPPCRQYVSRAHVLESGGTWYMYYSGGSGKMNEGIGLATSTDGVSWTKDARNPMAHVDPAVNQIPESPPGACYRNDRVYTPSIVDDGSGGWKLYYTARAADCPGVAQNDYAVGLMELEIALNVLVDLRPGSLDNHVNSNAKMLVPIAVLGADGFDPTSGATEVDLFSVTVRGAEVSSSRFAHSDVNGDGYLDLVLYFRARSIDPKPTPEECADPDATITLTGATRTGTPLHGSDSVRWQGPDCR